MDDRNEFDDFFQEKFQDFQGQVKPSEWIGISQKLKAISLAQKAQYLKRTSFFVFLLGSTLFTLGDRDIHEKDNQLKKSKPENFNKKQAVPGANPLFADVNAPLKTQTTRKESLTLPATPESTQEKSMVSYAHSYLELESSLEKGIASSNQKTNQPYPAITVNSKTIAVSHPDNKPLIPMPQLIGEIKTTSQKWRVWQPFVAIGMRSNYQSPKPNTSDAIILSFESANWEPRITSWHFDLGLAVPLSRKMRATAAGSFHRFNQNIGHTSHYFQNYDLEQNSRVDEYRLTPRFSTAQEQTVIKASEWGIHLGLRYSLFQSSKSTQVALQWHGYFLSSRSTVVANEDQYALNRQMTQQLSAGLIVPLKTLKEGQISLMPNIAFDLFEKNFNGPFTIVNRSVGLGLIWDIDNFP